MGIFNKWFDSEENDNSIFGLFVKVFNSPATIEGIVRAYSDPIDKIILETSKKEKLDFKGGIFSFQVAGEDKFKLKYALYFQNSSEEWVQKSSESKELPLSYLTPDAKQQLLIEKEIKMEINEPETVVS